MASTERSRLTIHDAGDGVVVLVGEIDAATAPKLHRCLEHDPRIRVLDMAQVTFMDSSGLKELIAARQHLHERSATVRLSGVRGQVQRLSKMTGVDELFATPAPP